MGRRNGTIEQLQKSEERFRRVFENAPVGICVAGLDGSILQVNGALCRMVGYSEEEMLATVWGELDHPDDLGPSLKRLELLLQDQDGSVEAEKRYIHRNGSVVWGRMRASLARDGVGNPLYFVIHGEDITERKRVEDALHESEERFRIMADGCPTMMWVSNAEGGIQFINRTCREFFGITYEEAEGGKWQLLVHPDDVLEYAKRFQCAVHEHTTFKIEARVRCANGEWRWVSSYAEPRFSSSGEFLGHVGLSPDITERKQAEEQLQFQHSLLRGINEGALDGILVVNQEGMVVSLNQRYLDVWQISPPEIPENLSVISIGTPFYKFFSACLNRVKDPESFVKRVRELYDDPNAKDHCEIALQDGRTLERYSSGLRSESCKYLGRVWFFRDITARKKAEQALQRSEEKFRQFAENIDEVIWMVPQTATEKPYVSPAYEQVWGRTCESLYQNPMSWLQAIHPDDLEPARKRFAAELAGEAAESQYRIRTPDGQEKWIRDRTFPVFDAAGQLIRVVGIAEEITQRKRYEAELALKNKALETSEELYRKLIDLSPSAIIVGRNHMIALVNKAAVELFGVSSATDLIGGRFADLVNLEAGGGTENLIRRMYECEAQLTLQEGKVRRKDGSLLDVEVTASSFREDGGGVVQAVVQNITPRKQDANELVYRDRLLHAVTVGTGILVKAVSIEQGMPGALRIVGESMQVDRVLVAQECPNHPVLLYIWETQSTRAPVQLAAFRPSATDFAALTAWRAQMNEGKPVIAQLATSGGAVRVLLEYFQNQSTLLVPIFVGGKIWGNLGVDSCSVARQWTASEIDTLQTFADLAGSLILRDEARLSLERAHGDLVAANSELKRSIAENQALKGMLPMCAWCKQIREADGQWIQFEDYIQKHSGVFVTHGMCPACAKQIRE